MQPPGQCSQLLQGMLQISFRPLRRGNVAIDCIACNLFAWYRNRHTDHENVYTAAVLALANGFGLHSLPHLTKFPNSPTSSCDSSRAIRLLRRWPKASSGE